MKVYQTYFKPIPEDIVKTNLSNIPVDVEYEFYDDDRLESYMSRQPSEVYERYKNLYYIPWKIDLWRYCILYENGGMYIDADGYFVKKIDKELFDYDSFFFYDSTCNVIYNGCFYTYPRNPILSRVIDYMVTEPRIPAVGRHPLSRRSKTWYGVCKKPANTHWSLAELTRVLTESCSLNFSTMHLPITIGRNSPNTYPAELMHKNITDEFGKSVHFFYERYESEGCYGAHGESIFKYRHDSYPYYEERRRKSEEKA